MKLIKYIWILIIIYLACTARTCVEDEDAAAFREEKSVIAAKDSIRLVFTSDSVSDLSLRAYELTAAEKLIDFADYLKISADTTLDTEFRRHALEMASSQFITKDAITEDWYKGYPINTDKARETKGSVLALLNTDFWAMPEKIVTINPLIMQNDSTYKGRLSFYKKWSSFSGSELPPDISGPHAIEFYLIKTMKFFGGQQLKVWDVTFGHIEEDNRVLQPEKK